MLSHAKFNSMFVRSTCSFVTTVRSVSTPGDNPKTFGFDDMEGRMLVSKIEFAQDHESGLRSDRGPIVLCDFSKLRFWKSPYDFLNLYGRFCPYNPPYNPRHDTLSPNLHIKIST